MRKKAIIYTENTENLLSLVNCLVQDEWEIISGGETAKFFSQNLIPFTMEPSLVSSVKVHDGFISLLNLIVEAKSDDFVETFDVSDYVSLVCINIIPKFHKLIEFVEESASENCINLKQVLLLQAAAKNYSNVLVLTSPDDYDEAIIQLKTGSISKDFRLYLAGKALNLLSAYEASVASSILFQRDKIDFPDYFVLPYAKVRKFSQGANPHQQAAVYTHGRSVSALSGIKKIQGREVDYNILKNSFAAWKSVSLFLKIIKNPFEVPSTDCSGYNYITSFTPTTGFVFTICIKYGNPIGAALGTDVCNSFRKTFNCVADSYEGSTLGCSSVIDENAARFLVSMNISVIIAPDYTKEAKEILSENKGIDLIVASNLMNDFFESESIDGGVLVQISDHVLFKHWNVVTAKRPTQSQVDAMAFGMMLILCARSDSAVIVNDSAAIGISFAQSNRRKAVAIAVDDAKKCFKNNLTSSDTNAEILVSDSSIPYDDILNIVSEIGVKAIIQTGGSSSDQQVIDFCNEHEISMVFTKMSHIAF